MWFVKNPEWFDVIVTDNMFGDIITDLGAMIQGGMGIAAGGNINPAGRQHVRADRRQRPQIHRPGRHQPAGGHLRRRRCCWISWAKPRPPRPSKPPSSTPSGRKSRAWLPAKWATQPPRSATWWPTHCRAQPVPPATLL